MGEVRQGLIMPPRNPLVRIQFKFKEFEIKAKSWLSKQPIYIEAAASAAAGAAQGALIGALMGTLNQNVSSSLPMPPPQSGLDSKAMVTYRQAQSLSGGPLVQARNFAVMTGVNVGISTVLKRVRGKEDVQSSMIAAFGSGAMFSLVSGMGGPNQLGNVVTSGLFFALAQGGMYKLGENLSKPKVDDPSYMKTKSLLKNLGLDTYEKNFKKSMLNDFTLPLLTDSALKDARIPPGPRLLILDHIERDPEMSKRQKK